MTYIVLMSTYRGTHRFGVWGRECGYIACDLPLLEAERAWLGVK